MEEILETDDERHSNAGENGWAGFITPVGCIESPSGVPSGLAFEMPHTVTTSSNSEKRMVL